MVVVYGVVMAMEVVVMVEEFEVVAGENGSNVTLVEVVATVMVVTVVLECGCCSGDCGKVEI